MFCREQVAGFRSRADELKRAGVKLLFIGNGLPMMAQDFQEYMQLDAQQVWTDPKRRTFAHLDFAHGWRSVLNLSTIRSSLRAMRAGFRQGKTQGDPIQQGGVLVVKRGGEVVYGYASAVAGDHPPIDVVMAKALEATKG